MADHLVENLFTSSSTRGLGSYGNREKINRNEFIDHLDGKNGKGNIEFTCDSCFVRKFISKLYLILYLHSNSMKLP